MDLQQLIRFGFRNLEYDQQTRNVEWSRIRGSVQKLLLDPIILELKKLEEENRSLKSKLNQLSFKNIPERDNKIIELYERRFSKAQIAKLVGMSKWGITLALRRLSSRLT
jgi:hypothetical protein